MPKGRNNYQSYNGMEFKNETEVEFYTMCENAVKNKEIKSFVYEETYELFPQFLDWRNCKVKPINHTPDFILTLNDDSIVIVDTKGGGSSQHDKTSVIKRKIWMFQNKKIPYYMVSKTPVFLGGQWVETSSGHDFSTKLRSTYKELFPNENVRKWRTCKKFLPVEWTQYFDCESKYGLFYVMYKKYTKKELKKKWII